MTNDLSSAPYYFSSPYYGQLVVYENEVHGSGWKWNGTNLVLSNIPTSRRKAVNGTNLFSWVQFDYLFHVRGVGVARWDGAVLHRYSPTNVSVGDYGNFVSSLITDGNDVYVAGHFGGLTTTQQVSIARCDGTNWYPLGTGLTIYDPDIPSDWPADVYCLAAQDGCVYAGGRIDHAGGLAVTNIAKWDGTNWHTLGNALRGCIPVPWHSRAMIYTQRVLVLRNGMEPIGRRLEADTTGGMGTSTPSRSITMTSM